MKIVVLDGYTLNPGDLDWEDLNALGEVTIYDRTPTENVLDHAKGAEILLTNKTPIGEEVLRHLPYLKYIGVLATGYNVVHMKAAHEMGLVVTNVPGYSTASVAQLTFALILELCHRVQWHSDRVMEGAWAHSPDFSFWQYPLIELAGKKIGIIGYGNIGSKVGEIAMAFGMQVLATGRTPRDLPGNPGFRWTGLKELLEESDIVSIHCPLVPETEGLINADNLKRMKSSAFLINTSRGPVVVEKDLAEALQKGVIAGAGIDVLSKEPPSVAHPLWSSKNCIITPHIAWATIEARKRLMATAVHNIACYISGKPVNVVH